MKIGCVILAGGKSSRMGSDKALLEISNKTFIENIMEEFDDFDEKIISRGNNAYIDNSSWIVVSDDYESCGPIGGMHKALSICQSEALFFTTCDMPFMKKSIVSQLYPFINDYDAVVVKDCYDRVHPLCGIYRKSILNVIEKQILSHDYRIMDIFKSIKVKYVDIHSSDYQLLLNINTLEDYKKIK